MQAQAEVALNSARTYLNDVNAQMWTDSVLLPFLIEAHHDLMLILWLNGLPVIKVKSSTIQVPAGETAMDVPADLIEPILIKERAKGDTDNDWIPMTEASFTPDFQRDTTLRYYAWAEETIELIGATTNREVLLRYWAQLAVIVDSSSSVGCIFGEFFLGPQCAAYAASSVGNTTLAKELYYIAGNPNQVGVAGSKLDIVIRGNVKGQQNLPARRIPYRRFARSRLLL